MEMVLRSDRRIHALDHGLHNSKSTPVAAISFGQENFRMEGGILTQGCIDVVAGTLVNMDHKKCAGVAQCMNETKNLIGTLVGDDQVGNCHCVSHANRDGGWDSGQKAKRGFGEVIL